MYPPNPFARMPSTLNETKTASASTSGTETFAVAA